MEAKTCPSCLEKYSSYPAISRVDNETKLCSDCGTMEALEGYAMIQEGKTKEDILNHLKKQLKGGRKLYKIV